MAKIIPENQNLFPTGFIGFRGHFNLV